MNLLPLFKLLLEPFQEVLLVFTTWAANVLLAWTAGAFTNLEAILQPFNVFTSQFRY